MAQFKTGATALGFEFMFVSSVVFMETLSKKLYKHECSKKLRRNCFDTNSFFTSQAMADGQTSIQEYNLLVKEMERYQK